MTVTGKMIKVLSQLIELLKYISDKNHPTQSPIQEPPLKIESITSFAQFPDATTGSQVGGACMFPLMATCVLLAE
jgi:hypothetical protein